MQRGGEAVAIDWLAIRNEYVTLGKSVSELAKAYELKRSTVGNRCAREGWEALREQFVNTLRTDTYKETSQAMASSEADRLARMMRRSDRLGELCDMWIERAEEKGAKPQDIKAMAEALLKLSEVGRVAEPEDKEITVRFERPEWAE